MKNALIRVFSSMKVWTALIALIVVFAARYGFEISEQMTALVTVIFTVLIGAQGATDFAKNSKQANDNSAGSEEKPKAA